MTLSKALNYHAWGILLHQLQSYQSLLFEDHEQKCIVSVIEELLLNTVQSVLSHRLSESDDKSVLDVKYTLNWQLNAVRRLDSYSKMCWETGLDSNSNSNSNYIPTGVVDYRWPCEKHVRMTSCATRYFRSLPSSTHDSQVLAEIRITRWLAEIQNFEQNCTRLTVHCAFDIFEVRL